MHGSIQSIYASQSNDERPLQLVSKHLTEKKTAETQQHPEASCNGGRQEPLNAFCFKDKEKPLLIDMIHRNIHLFQQTRGFIFHQHVGLAEGTSIACSSGLPLRLVQG